VITIAFVAAVSALMLQALPVAAECPYLPAWPPISKAIATAHVIVVGTVVTDFDQADLHLGTNQGPRRYALRVTEVVRGDAQAGDLLDAQYLLPNWPQTRYANDAGSPVALASCNYLHAVPGEVIALALDALQPGGPMRDGDLAWVQPPTRYNAVGVIMTTEPYDPDMSPWNDREPITLAHLRSLAALPMTDAAQRPGSPSDRTPIVLVAGLAAALVAARRFRGDQSRL
jgi:hypothetical protein